MTEGFEAWNEIYAPPAHAGVSKPLLPGSVFLFESVSLGHAAPSGWDWFDSPRDLAGYLLHVALPDLAGWWFDETTTFGGPPTRLPLRQTIAWIGASTEASSADRDLLMTLAADLEALLAGPESVSFNGVAGVVERFSARFADQDGRWMTLKAYPNSVAAGTVLCEEQDDLLDSSRDVGKVASEWLDLCARAGTDPSASEKVAEAFSHAHSV
ncbi:hypothetical protein A5667_23190 [Mycolicibacterium fortuitum]|uniref:hypothetical protein n=1 Tax=Mycolicibacterium fortuitum TaxID=1766 RepID=UPI0007ED6D0E|nr:hypothetical protein [Mycolicibacterium fortuitum]OBI55666.1 hypothetical protein A5667_23190 [Mycolicibacterium fortuitum]